MNIATSAAIRHIVVDRPNKCVRDEGNGDYLTFEVYNRDSNEWYFWVISADDRHLLGAIVRIAAYGVDDRGRGATHMKFTLRRLWVPDGSKKLPRYITGETPWLGRLGNFLEVYKDYYGVKDPDPVFEYEDGRGHMVGA